MNPSDFITRASDAVAQYPLVALMVAIAGGLFSTSTCPCTLPTGVGIVGYVGSAETARGGRVDRPARWHGAVLSLAFFIGLVVMLTALGTLASVVGRLLTQWARAFSLGAAGLTLAAGVATLFGPVLRQRIPDPMVRQRSGVLGAFGYGICYSVATITSSAGPLLLLLTVSAAMGRPAYGFALSLAFALGRGLPFLLLGLFAGRVSALVDEAGRARRLVEILSGVALVGLSLYFVRLATFL